MPKQDNRKSDGEVQMKKKRISIDHRETKSPSKQYLIDSYKLAKSDAALAVNDGARAAALRDLKRIFELATLVYGFDFADSLNDIK